MFGKIESQITVIEHACLQVVTHKNVNIAIVLYPFLHPLLTRSSPAPSPAPLIKHQYNENSGVNADLDSGEESLHDKRQPKRNN